MFDDRTSSEATRTRPKRRRSVRSLLLVLVATGVVLCLAVLWRRRPTSPLLEPPF